MKRIIVITFAAIVAAVAAINGGIAFAESDNRSHVQPTTYAALGDSVAAGFGLPIGPAATDEDTRCRRSPHAYAAQVADSRGLTLAHIACSGAKASDLFTEQDVTGGDVRPQLNAAFENGTPALISITAGANDVRWNDFVAKCFVATCGSRTDDKIAKAYIAGLKLKLRYSMYDIFVRSRGTPPPVVLTGYYNALSPTCALVQTDITAEELAWLSTKLNQLNEAIRDVSSDFWYARFAPVDFTGHDICSSDPWVQNRTDTGPFHPTITGQAAIARAVLAAIEP